MQEVQCSCKHRNQRCPPFPFLPSGDIPSSNCMGVWFTILCELGARAAHKGCAANRQPRTTTWKRTANDLQQCPADNRAPFGPRLRFCLCHAHLRQPIRGSTPAGNFVVAAQSAAVFIALTPSRPGHVIDFYRWFLFEPPQIFVRSGSRCRSPPLSFHLRPSFPHLFSLLPLSSRPLSAHFFSAALHKLKHGFVNFVCNLSIHPPPQRQAVAGQASCEAMPSK